MAAKKTPRRKTQDTAKASRAKKKKAAVDPRAEQPPRDPRLPEVGSTLTRNYKGQELAVKVLDTGFEYESKTFTSLSGLARHIVGYSISGPAFFKLAASMDSEQEKTS